MLSRVRRALAVPAFDELADAAAARILNALLWAALALVLLCGLLWGLSAGGPAERIGVLLLALLFAVGIALGQPLLRSGRLRLASLLLVGHLYAGFTLLVAAYGDMRSPVASLYVLLVAVAAVLLGQVLTLVTVAISVLTGLALVYAETAAAWLAPAAISPLGAWLTAALVWTALGAVLALASQREARLSAAADRRATGLQLQLAQLREAGRARTAALDRQIRHLGAVTSISRDVAHLQDLDALLSRTVSLAADYLGLYHVGAYVLDDQGEWLDLWASADPEAEDPPPWEPRVHTAGASVVGRVAATGAPFLAPDARAEGAGGDSEEPAETRARLALPILTGRHVLGVLDLHSRVQGAFEPEDAALFAMLADQVAAVWMHIAALRAARAQGVSTRTARGQSVAESWRLALQARRTTGVVRTAQGFAPPRGAWRSEMVDALESGTTVVSGAGEQSVAVPVSVRGETIAVLEARRSSEAGAWPEQDLSLLQALAVELGEALENARLYEDVRRREAQERLLSEATTRMRASLDPETVLRAGAQEIRAALGLAALDIRVDLARAPSREAPDAD